MPLFETAKRHFASARVLAVAVLAAAFGAMPGASHAVPAISFNETTGGNGINQNQSVGWQFDVLSTVVVTGLGWFDEGADGLGREHTVGIWDSAGNLLASVLVPMGAVAALDGQYRMVPIAPILLSIADDYIVGGQNFSDSGDRLASNVSQVVHPSLSYDDATFSGSGGFMRPANFSVSTTGFYGPMFALVSIPAPGTLALLGLGLGAMAWLHRRRRPLRLA